MVAPRLQIPVHLYSRSRSIVSRPRSRRPRSLYPVLRELAGDGLEADVYLAFIGAAQLQLSGFLVTAKSNINAVIAHCPVEIDPQQPKDNHRHIQKQLDLARRIAQNPELADEMEDAISLVRLIRNGRPVPRWVYALACIPLSYPTNGEFLYATPYCSRLRGELLDSH